MNNKRILKILIALAVIVVVVLLLHVVGGNMLGMIKNHMGL